MEARMNYYEISHSTIGMTGAMRDTINEYKRLALEAEAAAAEALEREMQEIEAEFDRLEFEMDEFERRYLRAGLRS
jgi:hypothetical protein